MAISDGDNMNFQPGMGMGQPQGPPPKLNVPPPMSQNMPIATSPGYLEMI